MYPDYIGSTSTNPASDSTDDATSMRIDLPDLRIFVFALLVFFGVITSLNDIIIPKLKGLFTLSYAEAILIQSAFFAVYFVVPLPGAAVVRCAGYMRAVIAGLLTLTVGYLLFIPTSSIGSFPLLLGALLVLAAGITVVQVVANPLISILGTPATAHSRLTFAQTFNCLGTTIFPCVGSILILGALATVDVATLAGADLHAFQAWKTQVIVRTYIGLAIALSALAGLVWMRRKRLEESRASATVMLHASDLLRRPRFTFGAMCIFLYVGSEVAVGSLIVNYLMQADVFNVGAAAASKHVPLYWSGAMVGRFIGAWLLRVFSPGRMLAWVAALATLLLLISADISGEASSGALLSIGLFNSIMFPTIFSLASEGLGRRAGEGAAIICVAIVGGAIVPLLAGAVADAVGLKMALVVPAICYVVILCFGLYARRPQMFWTEEVVNRPGSYGARTD
jgi:FHS family L-fucose permease-like MFS transporter